MQTTRIIGYCAATLATMAVVALSAGCGGGGGGGSSSGVPGGHSVGKTVSFTDNYGKTTVGVESAGTSDTIFKDLFGKPNRSENGVFVFVTLDRFDSPVLGADELLAVKGSDGKLYESSLSDGPDSGGALVDPDSVDPNHFTEAFDLPEDAATGAVLIVHEDGLDQDIGEEDATWAAGAHEVDLGL